MFSPTISNRSLILCYQALGSGFRNLNLLHFNQIMLEVFIDQSLLTGSIKFGSSVDEAPGPSLTEGTVFRERERKRKKAV